MSIIIGPVRFWGIECNLLPVSRSFCQRGILTHYRRDCAREELFKLLHNNYAGTSVCFRQRNSNSVPIAPVNLCLATASRAGWHKLHALGLSMQNAIVFCNACLKGRFRHSLYQQIWLRFPEDRDQQGEHCLPPLPNMPQY